MSTNIYKVTPFKAGTHKNTEPTLQLVMTGHDEDRKHIHVETSQGTKLLLAYDGKAECFHLHKYSITGKVGGKVYNNWILTDSFLSDAMERW